MIGHDRLRRSYQRLLRVYPRWYRRERGLEVLTTMLDDASPEQRRPALGDVWDVLRAGVRMRLLPPYRVGGLFVVTVVSLYLALVGAATALALVGYPGPPSDKQAIAAAATGVGILPRNVVGPPIRCGAFCDFSDNPADQVVAYDSAIFDHSDFTRVTYAFPRDDAVGVVSQARQRLIDSGWAVSPMRTWSSGAVEFEAAHSDVSITVTANMEEFNARTEIAPVQVDVRKGFLPAAFIAALAGFVGTFLLSWPLVVWILHRYRRHQRNRRRVVVAAGVPVLAASLLTLWGTAVFTVVGSGLDGPSTAILVAPQVAAPGLGTPVLVGVGLLMLAALLLAGGPSRDGRELAGPPHHDIPAMD